MRNNFYLKLFWSEAPFFSVLHIYIYLPALGPAGSETESPPAKEGGYETISANDFRRASEGKKRGDQQAVVEHISPPLSSSLSLAHLALPLLLFAFARVFSLSLSLFSHCTALLFLALIRINCSKRRRRQPKFAAMSLL